MTEPQVYQSAGGGRTRHAWLVGATTAAMAGALLTVAPMAANADPGTAGELDFVVAPYSSEATPFTIQAIAGQGTGTVTLTPTTGPVLQVTITAVVDGITANETKNFTFTEYGSAGDITLAAKAGAAFPTEGPFTMTITPVLADGLSASVTQTFHIISGDIYVVGKSNNLAAIPEYLPIVAATYGETTGATGANGVILSRNGVRLDSGADTSGFPTWLPTDASYTLSVVGTAPGLAAKNSPFSGDGTGSTISQLPGMTGSTTTKIPLLASAPVTVSGASVGTWSTPATSPFSDVKTTTQFYNQMAWLNRTGVSTGYADGGYHPAATVKRNAMAAFLYRLAGSPAVPQATVDAANKAFSDLSSSTQFDTQIAWLWQQGITTGYANGTFKPGAEVTRGAMAAFLYRFANNDTTVTTGGVVDHEDAPASDYTAGTFSDVFGSTQFAGDIGWLQSHGIAAGYQNGSFQPTATIKRNAMAAFLYQLASAPTSH